MAFSVTGFRAAPDVGFRSESRRTAEGARDCAVAFISDGLREVEIQDGSGNLRSITDLDGAENNTWSFGIADKLASL